MAKHSFFQKIKRKTKNLFRKIVFWLFEKVRDSIAEERPTAQVAPGRSSYKDTLNNPFEEIVHDVVDILGYAGAMVATYEPGDALLVRAFYVNPEIATEDQIHQWEKRASLFTPVPISLTDPSTAVIYPYQEKYQENLGSVAFKSGQPQVSSNLFSLFTPVVPIESKGLIDIIQQSLKIRHVIAMPFYIETETAGELKKEFVGNLFAAKCDVITDQDEKLLSSFAHYIASFMLSQRQRFQLEVIENLILDIQKNLTNETEVLTRIARGVVEDLGYAGAMVATYEAGDALPVRALYLDPKIATETQIRAWEKQVSQFTQQPVSLFDPHIAVTYPYQEKYQQNLSAIAFKSGQPEVRDSLFSLFTPIAPPASKGLIDIIQQALNVKHVIAVPFFVEMETAGGMKKEFVGNLFALSLSHDIHDWEIKVLNSFGHQAGVGLRNVRLYNRTGELLRETESLYQKSESRREAAAVFGKMAFSAAASVHKLRNQIAAVKLTLHTVNTLTTVDKDMREYILNSIVESHQIPTVLEKVEEMKRLIESLHEPWKRIDDTVVDVNSCIKQAAGKVDVDNESWVKLILSEDELLILTTEEMLTEVFKVLIKNAREAMPDETNRLLKIKSERNGDRIEVIVADQGIGIEPQIIDRIFDMRFSTKEGGLGFGLFWAKDFIEGLGGEIRVQSELQKGTTFSLSFPACNV